jgi:CheY-like chemotaxis protein
MVLVVDDNPASRELVREALQTAQLQIVEASDGREALERIAEAEFDLVLLDIQLPILDGYAVLRRIRTNPRHASLRVVALTAYAMEGDRERALQAGFDAYITKPIHPDILRQWIDHFTHV